MSSVLALAWSTSDVAKPHKRIIDSLMIFLVLAASRVTVVTPLREGLCAVVFTLVVLPLLALSDSNMGVLLLFLVVLAAVQAQPQAYEVSLGTSRVSG